MSVKRIFVVACLSCLLVSFRADLPASGMENRFDGHFWRRSDDQTRQLLLYSYMSGVVQGQDRVAQQLLIKSSDGGFQPECHKAAIQNLNRLEAELAQWDRNLFMRTLDAFYAVRKNRTLELKWALVLVMQQLKGAAAEELAHDSQTVKPGTP